MRAPDARFEHAAAPDGNAMGLCQIMDAQSLAKPAYAPELDVDDPACLEPDRLFGVMNSAYTFIKTNRRIELRLQRRMIDDLVMRQRLLDHHQMEFVQLFEP